jgi:hypothetical protein
MRAEVAERILAGEPLPEIARWLNSLPEAIARTTGLRIGAGCAPEIRALNIARWWKNGPLERTAPRLDPAKAAALRKSFDTAKRAAGSLGATLDQIEQKLRERKAKDNER